MAARKKPARFRRLVEDGGVEMYTIRIVYWFDENGERWHTPEITDPDGKVLPWTPEALGLLLCVLADESRLSG